MKKSIILFVIAVFLSNGMFAQEEKLYREKYRPRFHFTPIINWMNDPNGLLYHSGEYHLFYQHNPFGNRWGHMSWGHSVSKDLLHWEHLPVALYEADRIMIFSGSAVADVNNNSGFAKQKADTPLVAIYTGHYMADSTKPDDVIQAQYIAYSNDKGRTWTKYASNPVLDLHKKDFRDPKVFWYAPQQKWIMLTVLPQEHKVLFHSSTDLKQWNYLSEFGPAGDTTHIWECPDLLQVPLEDEPSDNKWVLLNSQQDKMQYFVGDFDGINFKSDYPLASVHRPDYGPDYYAGITFNHLPAGHPPILLSWANNWDYANDIPTHPWKSAMALPRELSLARENNEFILIQKPLNTINSLRGGKKEWKQLSVNNIKLLPVKSQQFEMEISFTPPPGGKAGIGIAIGKMNALLIGYDAGAKELFLDRSGCSNNNFNDKFPLDAVYKTPLTVENGIIKLHLFFDNSIVEVFADGGKKAMTAQLFPGEEENEIILFSEEGEANFLEVKFWELASVWR